MGAPASIGSMIRFSWMKSREILFPFKFRRWFKILIIVWLAAAGVQAISMNITIPPLPKPTLQKNRAPKHIPVVLPQAMKPIVTPKIPAMSALPAAKMPSPFEIPPASAPSSPKGRASSEIAEAANSPAPAPSLEKMMKNFESFDSKRPVPRKTKTTRPRFKMDPSFAGLLMAGLVLAGAGFFVFFMWISSRFKFVLLEVLVTRNLAIRGPFALHGEAGNSYFKWALVFWGILIAIVAISGIIATGLLALAKWNAAFSLSIGILSGLVLIGILTSVGVLGVVMRDLVLPVMYLEKTKTMKTISKLFKTATFSWGNIFQYLFLIFGFWIVASVIQGLIGVLAAVSALIAGGIVAVPGIILVKILPFLAIPMIILGSLAAFALVLAVIIVIGMVMLPVAIFFRVFTLAYLTRLYPECDLLGFAAEKS